MKMGGVSCEDGVYHVKMGCHVKMGGGVTWQGIGLLSFLFSQGVDSIMYFSIRKVCKNCLCQREEHDIREDKEEDTGVHVGKLLFSPTVETLRRPTSAKNLFSEVTPSPRYPCRTLYLYIPSIPTP